MKSFNLVHILHRFVTNMSVVIISEVEFGEVTLAVAWEE